MAFIKGCAYENADPELTLKIFFSSPTSLGLGVSLDFKNMNVSLFLPMVTIMAGVFWRGYIEFGDHNKGLSGFRWTKPIWRHRWRREFPVR